MMSVRARALSLLEAALAHVNDRVRLGAVRSAGKIGDAFPAFNITTIPLEEQANKERRRIYARIAERLKKETSLRVLSALEDVLFTAWLDQGPEGELAEHALVKFSPPTELKVLRWTVRPWDAFHDFSALRSEAPESERSDWWIDRKRQARTEPRPAPLQDFLPLADEIDHAFPGIEGLLELLTRLAAAGYEGGPVPPWMWSVASRHPEYFDDISPSALLDRAPPAFRDALKAVWARAAKGPFQTTMRRLGGSLATIASDDAHYLADLLLTAHDRPEGDALHRILLDLACHPDPRFRRRLADWDLHSLCVPPQERLEIHAASLRAGYDRELVDHIWDDVEFHISKEDGIERHKFSEVVAERFASFDGDDDLSFPQLLVWATEFDTIRWLDVLERRLQRGGTLWAVMRGSSDNGGPVSPVSNRGDFGLVLARLSSWQEQDLIDDVERTCFQSKSRTSPWFRAAGDS